MPSAFVLSLLPYPFSLVFHHHVKTKSTTSSHANGSSSSSSSSSPPPPLPIGQRSFLERSFYQFGTHAAKHQIRVLLICCIVMTSLVYPALAIHYQTVSNPSSFSSTLRPNSLFNTPLLRPLFDDAGPTREFPFIRGLDFVAGNEDQEEGGVVLSEGGSSERSKGGGGAGGGVGGRVRMETIWIGEVSHLIASASPSAASLPGSALQPSSFDHEAFGAHLLAHVPTEFGLLFCSPSSTQPTPPDQPWAVWTCFLSEDGWEAVHWDEVAWKEILAGALEGLNGSATSWGRVDSDERSFLVDYSPSTTSSSNFTHPNHLASPSKIARLASAIPFPIILLYAFLLAWTFRALASFTPIHNQFGLAFTYVTELAISTICSGSVCVMMGWKLEGIPWFLLPFVIAVIGVENMVHVTRAVLSTSISLPVSERLSLGLAQSGPTITFTTLSDIGLFAVLGIVVGERVGAVRDFCTFTIIVLISDWFLIFAFFATVISIDMHRLELADVLGQQPVPTIVHTGGLAVRGSPSPSPNPTTSTTGRRRRSKRTKSSSQVLRSGFQAILRARTARNGTLVALVTVLVGLWYYYSGSFDLAPHDHHPALVAPSVWTVSHGLVGGEPRILGHDDEEGGVDFLGGSSSSSSSRARLWDLLNPNHHKEEFTFVVPSPTAIIISTIPHRIKPSDLVPPSRSSRSFTHFAKPFYWFIKVVVLPISITTFALYLLLLFLLKDAELLDAQRDRLEIGEEWEDEVDARRAMKKHGGQETEGSGNMVPPSMRRVVGLHQADVCLIGTSEDGEVIMSVGFDGIALVSKTGDPTVIQRLLFTVTSSSDRPILAAVDAKGSFCAVALSKGSVFVWSLDPTSLNPTPIAFSSSSSSSDLGPSNVSDMSFLPRSNGSPRDDVFSVAVSNSSILVVVREDGSLFEYRCIEKEIRVGLLPGEDSIRATCLWRTGRQDVSEVSFASSSSGRVDFLRRDDAGSWTEVASITPVQALESISHVTSAVVQVEGSSREVVAVASSSGVVSIWDVSEGPESIFTLTTDSKARITQIRVVDPILQQCGSCQERFGGFLLLVSTSESLSVHRISPRSLPATCNCSSIRRTSSSSEPRSSLEVPPPSSRRRGSSVSFAPPLSPGGTPKRLPSSPSAQSILSADYPMYVHGAHLKRLSNRQAGGSGRSEGVEDQEEVLLDESGSPTKEQPGRPSSPWSALREYLLGTVSIHRGGWEVLDRRRVVGFGKGSTTLLSSVTEEDDDMISETQSHSSSSSRWQIFQIDLSQPTNGPLLALSVSDLTSLRPTSPSSSSLDFNTNSPQPSSNPTSSSSTSLSTKPALLAVDTSEGSSLRRRRAERLKQFASQNLETPPPSVSHALIGPLVAAGSDRILAGTGNTIGAFVFSPLEREGESSAIGGGGAGGGSGSGIVGGGLGVGGSGMGVPSPLRRRVEKPRDF